MEKVKADLPSEVIGPTVNDEFYEKQNGIPMNEIEKQILRTVLGEMEEMKGETN